VIFGKLKSLGVLGMNSRIGDFMLPHNRRKDYPKVDDKVVTAELAALHGVPMPDNYRVFESIGDLRGLGDTLSTHDSFVVKPARGSKGNGIIVITGRLDGGFVRAGGRTTSLRYLRYHMAQILGGLYSLNGYPDRAIVQYMIRMHPVFNDISVNGVPDIRVIVFKGFPVMAMTRLPTRESGGRANLHQGALGVGIDLARGITTHCTHHNRIITHHPDTARPLAGIALPGWKEMLLMAVKGYELSGLGYLGVDIALDRDRGPMVLEMNARPGLAIQLANLTGLKKRLLPFADMDPAGMEPAERVEKALEIIDRGE
jgi:alpha-L-glutamate ligase-like protein